MAEIGIMKKLTIGGSTYTIPEYNLPIASASTLGGVKIGTGLSINSTTGVLSATGLDYDEADPVFTASAAYGITSSDISNWNSKTSNTGTVTSVRVQASSPLQSSTSTAQSSILNTTISFANQNKNLVLAGPSTGNAAAPTFRALVAADIPDLSGTYLTSYTETDPTVPSWAKASSKPTYTASEVGALPSTTVIPSKTSDLTNDSGFITSYTDEKLKWTASTSSNTYYPLQSTSTATTSTANTLNSVSFYQYYNTAGGYRRLILGNTTAYTSSGGAYGTIRLYGAPATYYGDLVPGVLSTSNTGRLTANRTWTLPDKTGTVALTSDIPTVSYPVTSVNTKTGAVVLTASDVGALPDTTVIPTVPTNISAFTNDSGYITSADVPEGASAYTGTISAVTSGNASAGSNNGFARGDHTHNITKATINTVLGTGSGTAKFYREDGTWATPAYTTNTDTKLQVAAVTSGTTYYPIVGTGTTAATRQYDTTGFVYKGTNGTTSAVGSAQLTLGNSTASGTANNKQGQLIMYGSNAKKATITLAAPSADISLALPTSGGTLALTSQIPTVPTSTGSSTTGITATTTATKTTLGTATSVTGVQSSTTTASKASGANGTAPTLGTAISIIGVSSSTTSVTGVQSSTTTASKVTLSGSNSFSATVTSHVLSFSHGAQTVSASDVTVPIKATSATTVPIKNASATSIPNVTDVGSASTWSFSDVTVPIKATSATSVPNVSVASATVSITDPGHTHSI